MNIENSNQNRKTHKEISVPRLLIILVLFIGVILNIVLDAQLLQYFILPILVGIIFCVFGVFGYPWKAKVYKPTSLKDLASIENSNQNRKTHKEISTLRIFLLITFGFYIGGLLNIVLDVRFNAQSNVQSLNYYILLQYSILPIFVGIIFGVFGYFWKVKVCEPMSLKDLTPFEWVTWLLVSIAISPFISGIIAYHIYKHNNRYPIKWKKINIILLIALFIDMLLIHLFSLVFYGT